jgi:hypothetical protein
MTGIRATFRSCAVTLCLAALLLALPGPRAIAQEVQLPHDLPEATLIALRVQIDSARAAELPTQPLVLKALEGVSKNAAHGQIVAAVRALRERLRIAASMYGTDRDEQVLEAAAAALYAGIDETTLRELARSTRPEALGMALVVLSDLVLRGVPVSSARRAVLSLSAAGADARALSDYRRNVDEDIRTGLSPVRAAEVRLRGMLVRAGGPGGSR